MRAYISANGLDVKEVLNQLREDLNLLPEQTKDFARTIFYSKEVQEFIVEANKRNLEQGLRPDGTYIEKIPSGNQKENFYERLTIYNRTQGKSGYKGGQQTLFVDLYKSGFFYDSLKVRSGSSELLEFSTDVKSEELERVWGEILGISGEDILELLNMLRPKIIEFVRKKLKVK